jgi:transposase
MLYTVRSERLLMEQLDYHFLFRWFVRLNIDDPVRDVTDFTKNRERLLVGEVVGLVQGLVQRSGRAICCPRTALNEHFTRK